MNTLNSTRLLRSWQADAVADYERVATRSDYLVTATPGAGKTALALTVARRLVDRRDIERVIVCAPTDHLRGQWAHAAARIGLPLDPGLSNNVGPVGVDYLGYVSTYAQVAAKPLLHRRRTETRRTLVILDEVHHGGDGLSWGDAIREAFDPARRRLALTGTPFRTAAETIPFVHYEPDPDGGLRSVADFTYGYRDALRDHVVRPVMFAAYSGVARWRTSAGEVIAASLGEPLSRDAETAAWRTVLDPAGRWIPHVIAAADHRLSELREHGMPDAGAMLLASDQDTARAYAAVITRVTGTTPVLAVSDDPKAGEKIDRFRDSHDRWLVAVRLVSEGVDVPRLAVGVWATSYRTPLFFAQAVGRFVRARRTGETATVFLPAVRPLLALAAAVETERDHVIPPTPTGDSLDTVALTGGGEPDSPGRDLFEALDADARFAHVLYNGRAVTGHDQTPVTDADADYLGLPGLLTAEQTAVLLHQREAELRKAAQRLTETAPPPPAPPPARAVHEQTAALRKDINAMVARYAARTGTPHAQVHAGLRRAVPGPGAAQASLAVLRARRDHLLRLLG